MLDKNFSYLPSSSLPPLLSSPLSSPLFSPQTPSPPAYPTGIKSGCFKIGQHSLLYLPLSSLTPHSSSPHHPSPPPLLTHPLLTHSHLPLPLQVGGIKPSCFKIGQHPLLYLPSSSSLSPLLSTLILSSLTLTTTPPAGWRH